MTDDLEQVLHELNRELEKVAKGLTFEFGPETDGLQELIISADGIREFFPAVTRLVAAAPELTGLKIIAFRPPKGTDLTIELGDFKLAADDIWFLSKPDRERIGLFLFIKGLSGQNEKKAKQASFILLDAALGEYVVETMVGFVEWRNLPEDPVRAGLTPFRQLPIVFRNN